MQITHEEAHRLIQYNTDEMLKASEKNSLRTHLETCSECRAYADSIQRIESLLRPLLQRTWNKQPIPLSVAAVLKKRDQGISQGTFLATRIAIVGIVCMGFIFSVWQFTLSDESTPGPLLASVPPIPTPSKQSTSTISMVNECEGMLYVIKENDTLERLAQLFLVSKEDILAANNMGTEMLRTGMQILIPICTSTPTSTVNALTTTYTPLLGPLTSTPDG